MTAQLILIRMPIDCLKTDNHEEQRNLVQKIYLKLLLPRSHRGTPLTISCPCSLTKNIWNECWPLSQQKYEVMEIQISIFNSFLKQQTVFFLLKLSTLDQKPNNLGPGRKCGSTEVRWPKQWLIKLWKLEQAKSIFLTSKRLVSFALSP